MEGLEFSAFLFKNIMSFLPNGNTMPFLSFIMVKMWPISLIQISGKNYNNCKNKSYKS